MNEIVVKTDLQLVVGYVKGEPVAKEDSMKMYFNKVKDQHAKFEKFSIKHIPRSEYQ